MKNISPPIRPGQVFRGSAPTPSGSIKKPTPRRSTPSMAFPPHPPRASTGSRQIPSKGLHGPTVELRGAPEAETPETEIAPDDGAASEDATTQTH